MAHQLTSLSVNRSGATPYSNTSLAARVHAILQTTARYYGIDLPERLQAELA